MRSRLWLGLVWVVAAVWAPGIASADAPPLVHSGFGTPVVDGVRSPGEWSSATQIPVFTDDAPGSIFYVMNDDSDLHLALWVPDTTLTFSDQFEVRFDNTNDDTLTFGDDQIRIRGDDSFYDNHFNIFWTMSDTDTDGLGAAALQDSGSFFEMSHPLNSGDVDDISSAPGDSLGACVRYLFAGSITVDFPDRCSLFSNAQECYLTLVLSTGSTVSVGDGPTPGSAISLTAFPNPVRVGHPARIAFVAPRDGLPVRMALYDVSGRRVVELLDRTVSAGPHTLRWAGRNDRGVAVGRGLYFLHARFGNEVRTTRVVVVD